MLRAVGIGGWRGWLGVLAIAVVLGLAYASLFSTVLGQWNGVLATPVGLVLLSGSFCLLILIWLLGAIVR
jgi:hypothetical protein